MAWGWWVLIGVVIALAALIAYDLLQRHHAILRNFPVIGHLRYTLESFGPELRQYIVTGNDDERPFSRNQRRWIYTSAKKTNTTFGFGTDAHWEQFPGYLIVKPAVFPWPAPEGGDPADWPIPCAKVLGGAHGRRRAFRPGSAVSVSGMSFGALSARAVESLNAGARLAGALQNTGEGGLTPYHPQGGDLVFQIGTGYFGCRDDRGRFDLARLVDLVERHPVRAIEIKLSQGAKPGVGGMLPAAKVTEEIARIRGVPVGVPCLSPPTHSAFTGVAGLLDFVERVADATGLPVGIKSAVGETRAWEDMADRMAAAGTGIDFVTVDGGEGGTGAGPLVFVDHVALPFRLAQARVHRIFAERGLHERVVFWGSGKLGMPETALLAFALGCDMVAVGREAMMAIGCIQAQRCHTGRCPTGVATQSAWLQRGLDPALKSVRLANYLTNLRRDLVRLARACGVPHPALVTCDQFEVLDGDRAEPACRLYGQRPEWSLPTGAERDALAALMDGRAGVR